jgi:hypothetical protein
LGSLGSLPNIVATPYPRRTRRVICIIAG